MLRADFGGWPVDAAALVSGRWRAGLRQRMGLAVPPVQPGAVWLHAASLGEVAIARRLVPLLAPAFVTAETDAGVRAAGAARPVDHPLTLAPLWAEARPRLVVFVEGAWWPALARLARERGVPVVSIAARFHARRRLGHALMGWPDAVWAQTAADAAAFAPYTRVLGVSGSLKGGEPPPNPLRFEGPFVVGVCTRPGDEEAWLAAVAEVLPGATVLLAPRHLARVASLEARWPHAHLRSRVADPVPAGSLVLLDRFGELAGLLVGARAAFVGGTFDPRVQGHSPAEALAARVPVVHGPQIASNAPAFVGTHLAASPAGLADALRRALAAPVRREPDRVDEVGASLADLAGSPAPEAAPRPWARPLAPLHRARTWLRRSYARSLPIPVVAVGSSNARGAGKTSLARLVADHLAARGVTVGVVTRGVGARHRRGDSASDGASVDALGDEGAVLARAGHRVVAAPWLEGARRLQAQVDVVLLEDGLLAPLRAPLRLATVDCRYPNARGAFPAGEARGVGGPVHAWIHVHASARFPAPAGATLGRFVPGPWVGEPPGPCAAFAGIGRPADFFATVSAVRTRAFRDHHRYGAADRDALLAWADGLPLATTERDAVRLPEGFAASRGVRLEVDGLPWEALLAQLEGA